MSSSSEERDVLPVVNPQLSESPEADNECMYSMLEILCVKVAKLLKLNEHFVIPLCVSN